MIDGATTISGCSRKHNPETKNRSQFKYAYSKEELSQYLTKNVTPSKRFGRDRSNTSHFEKGMVPNEKQPTVLGGSSMKLLLVDKSYTNKG